VPQRASPRNILRRRGQEPAPQHFRAENCRESSECGRTTGLRTVRSRSRGNDAGEFRVAFRCVSDGSEVLYVRGARSVARTGPREHRQAVTYTAAHPNGGKALKSRDQKKDAAKHEKMLSNRPDSEKELLTKETKSEEEGKNAQRVLCERRSEVPSAKQTIPRSCKDLQGMQAAVQPAVQSQYEKKEKTVLQATYESHGNPLRF